MKKPPKKERSYPKGVMWPQELQHVGRILFGRQWRAHVASILKVDQKIIDKWMTAGAPGWIAAHLEKVGYAEYDKMDKVTDNPADEERLQKLSDCTDLLYAARCSYRAFKGLPPPPLFERPKQVQNPKFPKSRR